MAGSLLERGLRVNVLVAAIFVVAGGLLHGAAFAQRSDEAAGEHELALEEVVVTAQRREQLLTDVPISITAFSEAKLQQYNIKDAQGFLSLTPNVAYGEEGERGARSIQISIRGIGNLGGLDIGSDAIGIFYDEVNINTVSQGTANPMLRDIERIEVLRGPQGTYFGTNASGGAMSFVPNKPDSEPFAKAEASIGNHSAWSAGAVLNTPVTENLFARMVAYYEESPGIVKNVNEVGGDSSQQYRDFRFSVRWLPTDNWVVDGAVNYSLIDEGVMELVATGVFPPNTRRLVPAGFTPVDDGLGFYPDNERFVNMSVLEDGVRARPYFDTESAFVTIHAAYTGAGWGLKSITGYVDTTSDKLYDQDKINARYAIITDDFDTEAWSQEIRLFSTGENVIDWVIGGIYLDSQNSARRSVQADEQGFFPFAPGHYINRRLGVTDVESYAIFGDVTWHVTERFSASLGLRYANDKYKQKQIQTFNARPPNIVVPVPDVFGGAESDDLSPRLNASYDLTDDTMLYATISKGYRPGGVRLNPNVPPAPYDEENLWNYEIGLKGTPLGNRVQFGLSVFYMDWKDAQFESGVFLQTPGGEVIIITGTQNTDAVSKGVEAEFSALLTEHFTFSGGVGYLDAYFKDASTARAAGVPVDLTDQTLPKAPDWTLSASGNYTRELGSTGLKWFAQAEWKKRSETVGNLDAYAFLANPPGTDPWPYLEPSWDVTNLRLGISGDKFSVTANIENVFDDNYYTGTRNGVHLGGTMVRPHPRLYELRAIYYFR